MSETKGRADELVARLPSSIEVRRRLGENLREARLLRQLLKLAEQKQKVEEAKLCRK